MSFDLSELAQRENELQRLATNERESAKQLVEVAQRASSLYRNLQNSQLLYDKVVDRLGEVNLARDYAGFITEVIAPAQLGETAWPTLPLLLTLGGLSGLGVGIVLAGLRDATDRTFHNSREVEFDL